MDSLHRLEELFAHFPGIGPRQARRFVYYLLGKSPASIAEFIKLIEEVRKATSECSQCHRLFMQGSTLITHKNDVSICSICADPSRDMSTLMIVARDSDFESIEKSGTYKGLYFILGGTVPILDKEPDKRIRLRALLERVEKDSAPNSKKPIKEIILSLNTTPDGEHTENIVREAVVKVTKEVVTSTTVKITVLGRGLSTGAELEYADSETIRNALSNRK